MTNDQKFAERSPPRSCVSPRKGIRRRTIVTILSGVLIAACGSDSTEQSAKPRTPQVSFIVVKSEPVDLALQLAGRTSAFEVSEVRPQVTGIIRQRLFTEGSLVRAGQTLYRIDPDVYRAAQSEAKADLAKAEATLDAANVRANRLRPLAEIEAVSQQEYTDAVARAREAEATIAQIKARLDAASINIRNTSVPAPISGRIGRSLVTTGALVTANQAQPLTTIHRLDPMYVDIQQSSTDFLSRDHPQPRSMSTETIRFFHRWESDGYLRICSMNQNRVARRKATVPKT